MIVVLMIIEYDPIISDSLATGLHKVGGELRTCRQLDQRHQAFHQYVALKSCLISQFCQFSYFAFLGNTLVHNIYANTQAFIFSSCLLLLQRAA